jgi:hypothetical protein
MTWTGTTLLLYAFFWVIHHIHSRAANRIYQRTSFSLLRERIHHNRRTSDAGQLPKRKHTTFRTRRKFEMKNFTFALPYSPVPLFRFLTQSFRTSVIRSFRHFCFFNCCLLFSFLCLCSFIYKFLNSLLYVCSYPYISPSAFPCLFYLPFLNYTASPLFFFYWRDNVFGFDGYMGM